MGKFISLFSGVGGIDLGMEQAGHECVAQVEWDKNAAGVLKHRWPNVPLFCDVSKVSADDLPDADFITYGFPCQDLSVAGKREGLDGKRSGLFYEATRLIRELRTRGCGLRFAVAENVGGLFSADDGLALARCIRELLDCGACETGWRLLDSKYFGVAQRRKRVFIVSDFGGESVDEILAITESLPGHPPPSREAGKGTAGDATESVGEGGDGVVGCLCARDYKGLSTDNLHENKAIIQAQSTGSDPDLMATLCAKDNDKIGSNQWVKEGKAIIEQKETYCLQGGGETSQSGNGLGVDKDVSFTLNGLDKHGVAYEQEGIAFEPKSLDGPPRVTGDIKKVVSPALNCMTGGGREPAVVSWNGDTTPKASEDVSVTLRSQQGGEGVGVAHAPLTVRRLTPVECERLQGFPDNWTAEKMELILEGNEWKATGKVVKQADGPRYKQMGNAVTVNVAEWIGKQIGKVLNENNI